MPFHVLAEDLPKKLESEAPLLICNPPTALPVLTESRVYNPLLDNKSHFLFASDCVELIFFPLGLMGLCVQE